MNLEERFLKYISFDTQSDESSNTIPSTQKQWALAKELEKECKEIFDEVELSSTGIVYATLNATENSDAIGFLAHMDTATEISGANVNARIIEKYDGKTIHLNEKYAMDPNQFPALKPLIGDRLVVTDGHTLLGGDDKAGIAIIMSAMERLRNMPHGRIMVAFTVDEEIGRGTDTFDLDTFDVDYAYTVDGDRIDDVEYENFNAAQSTITIHGTSIHPGEAKGKMVNATLLAMDYAKCLPHDQTPATTEGKEGFYHLLSIKGNVEKAELIYIIRDFNKEAFQRRKEMMQQIADALNVRYGKRFVVETHDQYHNMADFMHDMTAVHKAKKAIENVGIQPVSIPVRGGTDGAMLTEKGLICPNLGTGTFQHHGRFEVASLTKMAKMVDIIIEIARTDK